MPDEIRPEPEPSSASRGARLATALLCAALTGALVIFVASTHVHYPVQDWLFWRYLRAGLLAAAWAISCTSMGCFLLERLGALDGLRRARPRTAQARPEVVLAFPLGVLAFQMAMFLLGLAGLLGVMTFVLLPLAFTLAGAPSLVAVLRELGRQAPPRSWRHLAVVLFGAGCVALIYFGLLSPEPFSWDARWYHLPLAQHYALTGAVRPFPEGWWLASYPHSASLVYAWAFLAPGATHFDHLELCAHLELAVFLGAIAAIPALVRELVPGASGRGTWVAMFLFPGIFLYDGNLNAGADHFAALWCIPIALGLIRVWRSWTAGNAILFAAFMAAGLLTKYSAWSMLFFPGCLFVARAIGLAVARVRRRRVAIDEARGAAPAVRVLPPFAAAGATLLVLSTAHWLKNWLWYGDPMYPVFYRHLSVHPWSREAPANFRTFMSFTTPPRHGWEGVKDALINTVTFSFRPNDWSSNHRDVPVFGSLFTLTLLCLPFFRAGVRLWLTYAGVMVTLVIWYLSNHQDRLLQAWVPVMAAATMASIILMWRRRHPVVRTLLVLLVSAQLIWGGDVPFFPTHNLIHDSPLHLVSNFLASGFLRTPNRLRVYGVQGEVAEALPRDAHLLLHELNFEQVGLNVLTVNDQWQGRIAYSSLRSPAAIYQELSSLGVTHMLWLRESVTGWNAIGSDLAFLGFALNYGEEPRSFSNLVLARFPRAAPPAGVNDRVVMAVCGGPYAPGLYRLGALIVPEEGEPWAQPEAPLGDAAAAARQAGFLVVDTGCPAKLPNEVLALFHPPLARPGSLQLYVRRSTP